MYLPGLTDDSFNPILFGLFEKSCLQNPVWGFTKYTVHTQYLLNPSSPPLPCIQLTSKSKVCTVYTSTIH